MKIETIFDIHDIIAHKFRTQTNREKVVYEILNIDINTCIAGAQVFYVCRPIVLGKKRDFLEPDEKEYWMIVNQEDDGSARYLCRYREDEIIAAPQDILDIILHA